MKHQRSVHSVARVIAFVALNLVMIASVGAQRQEREATVAGRDVTIQVTVHSHNDRARAADSLRILRSDESSAPFNPYVEVVEALRRFDTQPAGRRMALLVSVGLVDFIVEDDSWKIRYLVIDTRKWWRGKKVIISPQWIAAIDWAQAKVHVNLSREGIKQSPEYDSSKLISREYETQLYRHHGQTGYWLN
jgi:hypothetical protein